MSFEMILTFLSLVWLFVIAVTHVLNPNTIGFLSSSRIAVESPPKYSPSKIVGYLKGLSSKRLRAEFADHIKQYVWKENTLWARGYYVSSVADGITTKVVKEYIENQYEDQNLKTRCIQGRLFDES